MKEQAKGYHISFRENISQYDIEDVFSIAKIYWHAAGYKEDVFKNPHHGSKTGVDEFTFQHTKPKLAVLSVGAKNRYGHPSPEVIQILKENNIPYIDTKSGDVEVISDGVKWWVK
jgi:competence protein ComEC